MKPQKPKQPMAASVGKLPGWLLPAGTAVFLLLAIRAFGMVQFDGEDCSLSVDLAWRWYFGQKPYVDWIGAYPPADFVLPGLAFRIFGISWASLVLSAGMFSAAAFLFQYYLLRELLFPRLWSWLIALTIQSITILPLGCWQYSVITAVAAALFVSAATLLLFESDNWRYRASFTAAMALLSWMKPNVAGFLLVASSAIFLLHKPARKSFLICAAAAVAISLGGMIAAGVNPLAVLNAYHQASGRLSSITMLSRCFFWGARDEATLTFLLFMPLAVALLLGARMPSRGQRLILAMAIVSICGGFLGMATNNEINCADAPLVLLGVVFILFDPAVLRKPAPGEAPPVSDRFDHRQLPTALTLAVFAFFTFLGMCYTLSRYQVWLGGADAFFQDTFLQRIESPAFFNGLYSGPRLAFTLQEIQNVLDETNARREYPNSIFFGERMVFGYATYGIQSPKNLFISWPGTGEATDQQLETVTSSFIAWRPRLCIFLRNDFTYIPAGVLKFLGENYRIQNSQNLTILTLK